MCLCSIAADYGAVRGVDESGIYEDIINIYQNIHKLTKPIEAGDEMSRPRSWRRWRKSLTAKALHNPTFPPTQRIAVPNTILSDRIGQFEGQSTVVRGVSSLNLIKTSHPPPACNKPSKSGDLPRQATLGSSPVQAPRALIMILSLSFFSLPPWPPIYKKLRT